MKKRLVAAVCTAAMLNACSWAQHSSRGNSAAPQVAVDTKGVAPVISVRPDPLFFAKNQKGVRIVWSLPTEGFEFAENGIVIDGEIKAGSPRDGKQPDGKAGTDAPKLTLDRDQTEIIRCEFGKTRREFTCLNQHTRPGLYKYTIRVVQNGKPLPPFDPTIMND